MKRINSTRFLTKDELAKKLVALDMNGAEYPVGGIPLLVKDKKIYVDASDSHTMIFGATGSKKTRMFAMPSIGIFARAGESFVVTDPKGELFSQTAGDVSRHGYEVCCLNLRELKKGVAWNPLALAYKYYHDGKRAKAIEFATEMAKMIIDMDSTEEKFWPSTAVDIFTGFILRLFEECPEEECHLKSLVKLWNDYLENKKQTVNDMVKKYKGTLIYQRISYLNNSSDKTVGSLEAFIAMGLNKLAINEELMQLLSMKGIDIEEMAEGKKAIYLIIPDENKSYHFIVSLFLEQLYEVLIRKAQQAPDGKLPVRMNFLIDEFANIPKIENMDAMITASRSRNIRYHLIVQGMKQLRQKYEEGAEVLSGNCNNWVYLYSKEYSLLQDISRLCGEVIYDNNVRMPLFSEFDLQHLNKEEGEALVLAGRNCPCLSNLADISEYPYPHLDADKLIKTASWKEVSVCGDMTYKSENYFIPVSKEKIASKTYFWEEQCKRWLAAVGPENMILGTEFYNRREIIQKAALGDLGFRLMTDEGIEPDEVKWYSAPEEIGKIYEERLTKNPELVYLTLDELGIYNFKDEENFAYIEPSEWASGKYRLRMFKTSVDMEKQSEDIFDEEIVKYKGALGLKFAYNKLFRKTSQFFKGTEFEDIPWEEGVMHRRETYFRKMIENEAYVASVCEVREY